MNPPEPTPSPIGRVETDVYCPCGYNLHTLAVFMDERLKIPVCRCTECGRFHAVGKESAVNSIWLSRLGCLLTTIWFLFVIALLGWSAVGLFAMQIGNVELIWDARRDASDYYRGNAPLDRESYVGWMLLACGVAGLVYGGMVTVLLWHVSRARQAYALFVPLISLVLLVYIATIETFRGAELLTLIDWLSPALVQMLGITLGILVGRSVARGVLRAFLPPRLLQTLAFLWHADGIEPPPIRRDKPPTAAVPSPLPPPTRIVAPSPLE